MSELINNLNSIYNTKLAIKEVIGTDSDTFSEYPALIEEAIAGGVSGYSYIIANGDYDISTYEYVNVNVPGSVAVLGEGSGNENGRYLASDYNLDGFSSFDVNVPIPPGYIVPTGTYYILSNGMYDISTYENTYVNVQSGPSTTPDTFEYISKSELENSSASDQKFAYTNTILYTYMVSGAEIGTYQIAAAGATFILDGIDWYESTIPTGNDGRLYYFSGNNPNIRKAGRTISDNGYYRITNNDPIQNYGDIYVNVSGSSPSESTVSGYYILKHDNSNTNGLLNKSLHVIYDDTNSTYYTLAQNINTAGIKYGDKVTVTGYSVGISNAMASSKVLNPNTVQLTEACTYEYRDLSSYSFNNKTLTYSYILNDFAGDNSLHTYVMNYADYNNNVVFYANEDLNLVAGNTITAYVADAGEINGISSYYIREIVSNIAPTLVGMSYCTEWGGNNYSPMTYSSGYYIADVAELSSVEWENSTFINVRAEFDNGTYMYYKNPYYDSQFQIYTANTDYNKNVVNESNSQNAGFTIYNNTGFDGTAAVSFDKDNMIISARVNADASVYKLIHYNNSTGNIEASALMSKMSGSDYRGAVRWSSPDVPSTSEYYVAKFSDENSSTPLEVYKPASNTTLYPGNENTIILESTNSGVLRPSSGNFYGCYVYFNSSTGSFYYEIIPIITIKDSSDNTLTSFDEDQTGTLTLNSNNSIYVSCNYYSQYPFKVEDGSLFPHISDNPVEDWIGFLVDEHSEYFNLDLDAGLYTFTFEGFDADALAFHIVGEPLE